MANSTRLHFALVGGVSCAVVGSLLAGIALVLIRSWTLRGTESMAEAVAFFPMAVAFAAISAAPFGFIVGSIGSWWLAIRAARGVSGKRLYFESSGIGGVLGSTYPLILAAFGWGPFENLVAALPLSITIGIACGILIIRLTRKYRPLPSSNC
jgi:hypothetical protein